MAGIRYRTNSAKTEAYLREIQKAFKKGEQRKVLSRVAWKAHGRLVRKTPKGWTGLTRQKWEVNEIRGKGFEVTNGYKVMLWLEKGTSAHGPKYKKFLFIPLNRKAALGGWNPSLKRGKDYILVKRVPAALKVSSLSKRKEKSQNDL